MYDLVSIVFIIAGVFIRNDFYKMLSIFAVAALFAIAGSISSYTAMLKEQNEHTKTEQK